MSQKGSTPTRKDTSPKIKKPIQATPILAAERKSESPRYYEPKLLKKGEVSPEGGLLLHRQDAEIFALGLNDSERLTKLLESRPKKCQNCENSFAAYVISVGASLITGAIVGAVVF